MPANFERLERKIALNGARQAIANRTAVGDEVGEVSLGLADPDLVGSSTCDFTVGGGLSTVTAPVVTLDSYLEGRSRSVLACPETIQPGGGRTGEPSIVLLR